MAGIEERVLRGERQHRGRDSGTVGVLHLRSVRAGGRVTTSRNVISILTDQHRVDTLGAYGNQTVRTEHLDALAAAGTRFDRWYTPTAICTPARASEIGRASCRERRAAARGA